MNNKFEPSKYHDHRIVAEDGTVVGHIRVKPSGVLWSPKSAKVWYGLSVEKFGGLMVEKGKRQKK